MNLRHQGLTSGFIILNIWSISNYAIHQLAALLLPAFTAATRHAQHLRCINLPFFTLKAVVLTAEREGLPMSDDGDSSGEGHKRRHLVASDPHGEPVSRGTGVSLPPLYR